MEWRRREWSSRQRVESTRSDSSCCRFSKCSAVEIHAAGSVSFTVPTLQEKTMRKLVRRGFTLAEVLVTVTIVAVLAAVMVPAVINQVQKGDVPSAGQDMDGIRTAITTF